jgi:hypothetical protein
MAGADEPVKWASGRLRASRSRETWRKLPAEAWSLEPEADSFIGCTRSLGAQRDNRIDACGTPRRAVAGEYRHQPEEQGHG